MSVSRRLVELAGSAAFALAGVGAVGYGFLGLNNPDVRCAGKDMSPGDVCNTYRGGSATSRSYDEQAKHHDYQDRLLMGAGGVGILIGIGGVVVDVRRQRKEAAEDAYSVR